MQELNAIEQAFSSLVFYHQFFSAFFAFPFVLNLYNLFKQSNFAILNKKIWFCMPLIFFLLAVSLLSGLNIIFTQRLFFSTQIALMIVFWLVVLLGEIYRIKRLKIARRINEEAMLSYVKFCKLLYTLNLALFALVFFGSK